MIFPATFFFFYHVDFYFEVNFLVISLMCQVLFKTLHQQANEVSSRQ